MMRRPSFISSPVVQRIPPYDVDKAKVAQNKCNEDYYNCVLFFVLKKLLTPDMPWDYTDCIGEFNEYLDNADTQRRISIQNSQFFPETESEYRFASRKHKNYSKTLEIFRKVFIKN